MKTELTYSDITLIRIMLRKNQARYKREATNEKNSEHARAYCTEAIEDIQAIIEKLKRIQEELKQ